MIERRNLLLDGLRSGLFFWTLGALCASALSGCKGEDVAVAPLEKDGDPFGEAFDGGDRGTLGDAASMLADIEPFEPLPPDDPQALSAPLDALINGFPGRFAIYAANLKNGASAARGADESLHAGSAIRLLVLATYTAKVASGELSPDLELVYTPDFYRGGDVELTEDKFGSTYALSKLATIVTQAADPAAEELLLSPVGGSAVVNARIEGLGIEGIGRYLGPCELDRAYLSRLDPAFGDLGCVALGKWLRSDDARGLVPTPFEVVPVYDDVQKLDAWTQVIEAGESTVTARGLGELLAYIHAEPLPDDSTRPTTRGLLASALGSGGGGNDLPDAVWVSNIQGAVFQGRVWAAIVRGGAAPFVLVLMSDHEGAGNVGRHYDTAGRMVYQQLVGDYELAPPAEPTEWPAWLGAIFLNQPEETTACSGELVRGYDAQRACREMHQRDDFRLGEPTAVTVMVNRGPDVETTWLWTEPDGTRHRYQVRLAETQGWWAWTRSFAAAVVGRWRLDVWLNGEPYRLLAFDVRE